MTLLLLGANLSFIAVKYYLSSLEKYIYPFFFICQNLRIWKQLFLYLSAKFPGQNHMMNSQHLGFIRFTVYVLYNQSVLTQQVQWVTRFTGCMHTGVVVSHMCGIWCVNCIETAVCTGSPQVWQSVQSSSNLKQCFPQNKTRKEKKEQKNKSDSCTNMKTSSLLDTAQMTREYTGQ